MLKSAANLEDSASRFLGVEMVTYGTLLGKVAAGMFVYVDTVSDKDLGMVVGFIEGMEIGVFPDGFTMEFFCVKK